jgi:hypothetical protein
MKLMPLFIINWLPLLRRLARQFCRCLDRRRPAGPIHHSDLRYLTGCW